MKRGRHRNTFLSDPDRYPLALAHMYREMGVSRRGSIEIAVACTEGRVIGANQPSQRIRSRGLGMLDIAYELPGHLANANGIADRARGLRRKMKNAIRDEASVRWLATMSAAWWIALYRGPAHLILELAESAGEIDYARDVLLPVAGGRAVRRRPKKSQE